MGAKASRRRPPRPGDGAALAVAMGLVLLLLVVAEAASLYVPSTWIQRDGRFYTNVNVTLVEDGSVDQSQWAASWYERDLGWNRSLDAAWSNVARGANGERVPKHPILMPVLSTPLYWAFGLNGLLAFNLLCFAVAGAAAFAFARRYASPGAALIAAGAFLLATGIRSHVYDYHVDVLLLALWLAGLAALHARRGLIAGVLIAMAVMLKPTTIVLAPAAALLAKPGWRPFGWAIFGGAIALGAWAVKNTLVFGQPHWAGYNRMLVVEDGETVLAQVDAFSVPLREGLQNLWNGHYGVRHRMPLGLVGLVGLALLGRRRPLTVLAVLGTVAIAIALFATYLWYGDRFLWPALALALPGLALLLDRASAFVPVHRDVVRAGLGGALVAGVSLAAHHGTLAVTLEPWIGVALLGVLAAVTTLAARRLTATSAALLAPLALLLGPGVLDRSLAPGVDLSFAIFTMAALAARKAWWALAFAVAAGLVFLLQADPTAITAPLTEGPARGGVVLVGAAVLLVPALGRHALLLLPLGLLALPSLRALGSPWPLFALAVASLALPAPAERVGRWVVERWRAGTFVGRGAALLAPLIVLAIAGFTRQPGEGAPFRAASPAAVRAADVRLDHVPCDFLAWEHFNWECATFDRGVHGEVGLATSDPLHVGGEEARMLMISAPGGRTRRVRWEALPAAEAVVLEVAVPDEARGGGTLTVSVDGEERESLRLPTRPDGRIATHRIPVGGGEPFDLELAFEARGSVVLVDARLE
jgi:hypothetical protein